jgi:hypothetical protein
MFKTAFAALTALTFCAASAAAQAPSRDEQLVRQKVEKLWNQPHVQTLWRETKKNLNILHGKADKLSEGALSAFERQWLFHTKALMDKFYASDIPRRLSTGDWSMRDEVLFMVTGRTQAEYKADMLALEQEMLNAVKRGEITMEQFLALLKTLYEDINAPASADTVEAD